MGTEQMGVDLVLAWPDAQIGRVAPEAVHELYEPEIETANDTGEIRKGRIKDLISKYNNIYHAGARSLFNDIIDPRGTRPFLIKALNWFEKKNENRPWKKHGNIPL